MGRECTSSCPYYGVDENYNGYCKKDHNSYRERFSPCNMEGPQSAPAASAPAPSAPTQYREPRTCTSSCPYYGVDADYNGYCRKDHNSYRERFSTCNMGETVLRSGSGGGGGGGTGCNKWLVLVVVALMLLGGVGLLMNGEKATESSARDEAGDSSYSDTADGADVGEGDKADTNEGDTTTTTQPQEGETMYVVAEGGLRMRSEPNTNGAVILTIPTKSQVRVLSVKEDWSYVWYNGKEGWCASAWIYRSIADATSATTTQPTTVAPQDDTAIVRQGVQDANARMESFRGQTVPGSITKDALTEQEVLDLFHRAYSQYIRHLFGGIAGGYQPIPGARVYITADPHLYSSMSGQWQAGTHPDYPTYDALCHSFFSCLSDNLSYSYLQDRLALIDGKMYYTEYPGWGDEGVKHDLTYAVAEAGAGYVVEVTANYYRDDGNPDQITETKTYQFPCSKEDGAWVFTSMKWIAT